MKLFVFEATGKLGKQRQSEEKMSKCLKVNTFENTGDNVSLISLITNKEIILRKNNGKTINIHSIKCDRKHKDEQKIKIEYSKKI